MKWCNMAHGCMVYTECAETAAVSCGTRHVTTKQRCKHSTLMDIQKMRYKKEEASHLFRIACDMSTVSLLKTREQCYTKAISGKVNSCWSMEDCSRTEPVLRGSLWWHSQAWCPSFSQWVVLTFTPVFWWVVLPVFWWVVLPCVLVGCFTLCFGGLFYLVSWWVVLPVFWWVVLPCVLVGCFTCVLRNSYCQDLDSVLCVKVKHQLTRLLASVISSNRSTVASAHHHSITEIRPIAPDRCLGSQQCLSEIKQWTESSS